MTKLLVSVSSVAEAHAAIQGGADVIDVKEPKNGSLGRAKERIISAVCAQIGTERLVSAALGELLDEQMPPANRQLRYVKWGLRGCGGRSDWRQRLLEAAKRLRGIIPLCEPVAVSYADWEVAEAPRPEAICDFACEHGWRAYLLDTWEKRGRTLLDVLGVEFIYRLRNTCRENNIPVALAGSLGPKEISRLLPLQPNWFAVRRAACAAGRRDGLIHPQAVRRLVKLLKVFRHEN